MNYENSTAALNDMLLSKQENNFDLFFTRGRRKNSDIYFIPQSYFHLRKKTFRINCKIIILFTQFLKDIILLFEDKRELDMILQE